MSDVLFVGAGFGGSVPTATAPPDSTGVARLWEASQLDRLNAAHWQDVSSQPINDDLRVDLETLQRRAVYESVNNPIFDAAIETHVTDICGDHGPSLQMMTGNKAFDNAVEQLWSDWCERCEFQHNLALVDLLQGWVGQLWYHGEFLCQDVLGETAMDYKILDVGCDRLDVWNPSDKIVMGIEIDDYGRPQAYHVVDPSSVGRNSRHRKTKRVPAQFVVHGFRRKFAGQLRGIPIVAPSLPLGAEMRDYDTSVRDAARNAADQAVWLVSKHTDAPYTAWAPNERWQNPRRMARQAAPGWEPMALSATQPTAQYPEFRQEQERDFVLPGQMPLMILRKDSSKHNLSSARFDGVRYTRSITRAQAWFSRRALTLFLYRLTAFARLDGTLRIDAPNGRMQLRWSWPKPPSNDPVKDRMAERLGLENGTLTYSQALGDNGLRTDQVIEQRVKDNAALIAAGLTPIEGPIPTKFDPAMLSWVDDDEDDEEEIDDDEPDSSSQESDSQENTGEDDATA